MSALMSSFWKILFMCSESISYTGAQARGPRRGQPLLINEILTGLLRKIYFMVTKFSWDIQSYESTSLNTIIVLFSKSDFEDFENVDLENFDGNLRFLKESFVFNFLEHTEIL